MFLNEIKREHGVSMAIDTKSPIKNLMSIIILQT